MAKETKRLCHHIAHTSALPAGRMSDIQESCALLFVPPSPFPWSFSEHSLALFLPHALVPAMCVRGGWSTCLEQEGPGQQGRVLQWILWWGRCAAATLSGHTYISCCFLLHPWGISPPPSPVLCLCRSSSWELCVQTLPSPGKTLWGAGMTLGWGLSQCDSRELGWLSEQSKYCPWLGWWLVFWHCWHLCQIVLSSSVL